MKWKIRWSAFAYIALLSSGSVALAQDEVAVERVAIALQEQPATPDPLTPDTLPPVEVNPTPVDAPLQPFVGDGDSDPFDLPFNYPSLSSQMFEGASSASRGITRSVFDLPNNGTIIDRETIREKQAVTMMQALQNEVGVMVQQTGRGQSSIFLRGVTGQQVLILVDGIRVNNSAMRAGPNQYAALFDPGSIDHIEIIRGSQSTAWGGDAVGGVVNIVTRGASPNRGNYTGTNFIQNLSSADDGTYSRGNIEGWVGQAGVFTGASYLDNAELDRGGGLGPQPGTDYNQYAADLKFNYLLGEDDMLTMVLQHFEQQDLGRSDRFAPFVRQNIPTATIRPTYFDPQQRDLIYLRLQGNGYNAFYDTYVHTASWQRNKEGSTELTLPSNNLVAGEFDVYTWGYTMTFTKDLEQFGVLSYGGDYYNDAYTAKRANRTGLNGPLVPTQNTQYPADSTYDRVGTYALWDLQVTERLNLLVGGRYENVNAGGTPLVTLNGQANTPYPFERTYQDWIGNIGFVHNVTDELNFVGGIYEGFRAPTIDDLTADKTFLQNAQNVPTVGALSVQPEHSTTYEVGFKLDSPRLRGGIYQWWMNIDDYMTRITDQNNVVVLGNSNAALHGTEVNGEYLFNSTWSTYGNFFYTWGNDTNTGDVFPRIPPTQGTAGLRWRNEERKTYADFYAWMVNGVSPDHYPRSLFDNQGRSTDARFPTNGTPGYTTLNLRLGHTFGETDAHRVAVTFYNLTDKYYRVLGSGVDGEGFNCFLTYEFVH